MQIGTEWVVDAAGCRPESLRDLRSLRALFDALVDELQLKPLHEPAWHTFPGEGGITGFVMLTESHLACHTYPEYGVITINLYCCRRRDEWPWRHRLEELLGATEVRVQEIERSMVAGLVT